MNIKQILSKKQFTGIVWQLALFSSIFLLMLVILNSCKAKNKPLGKGTSVIISNEGWVDDNSYQMVVYGQWDRSAYYEESKGKASDALQKARPYFGLREDAKTAAKVKAMRNFKEKMLSFVESESRVENSELLYDVVTAHLRGLVIAPQVLREEYSKSHDASITFLFTAEGLRAIVDDAVQVTLRRFDEDVDALTDTDTDAAAEETEDLEN